MTDPERIVLHRGDLDHNHLDNDDPRCKSCVPAAAYDALSAEFDKVRADLLAMNRETKADLAAARKELNGVRGAGIDAAIESDRLARDLAAARERIKELEAERKSVAEILKQHKITSKGIWP